MAAIRSSDLDRQIDIERPIADDSLDGAGSGAWGKVAEGIWAQVKDLLPPRGERQDGGTTTATRSARVRMRYRDDVTSDMRFVMGGRKMAIVSGPVEIGRREGLEFNVEDYRPAGNAA